MATYDVAGSICQSLFDGAIAAWPEHWSYHYYGAKVARKIGAPVAEAGVSLGASTPPTLNRRTEPAHMCEHSP
jgi:hypothetical protein